MTLIFSLETFDNLNYFECESTILYLHQKGCWHVRLLTMLFKLSYYVGNMTMWKLLWKYLVQVTNGTARNKINNKLKKIIECNHKAINKNKLREVDK